MPVTVGMFPVGCWAYTFPAGRPERTTARALGPPVEDPTTIVKISDEVEVKILRVDIDDRKIGLSLKRAQWGAGGDTSESSDDPNRPAKKYKGGLEG